MIQDFAMEQDNSSLFDMVIDEDNKVIKTVEGLETAVSFQLFVDQRVTKEDRSLARARQGWIGDLTTRNKGYQAGSLLHLQQQSRDTQEDNNETAEYAKDALNYFVSVGATKEVTARVLGNNIEGEIINDANEVGRYSRLWRATNATNA